MKKKIKNFPSLAPPIIDSSRGNESSARLPSDYSHPTLSVEGAEKYSRTISFDVQVTVRSKVDFTRRQLCMLSGIALSDVAESGLSLSDWMILEYLYTSLLGNKQDPFERNDPKEFELSLLLKIVLLSGNWMNFEEKVKMPEDVQNLILSSRLVPKGRVKASWRQSWDIKKYIEFRTVPLENLLERSTGTNRYSSYCKGYGESSRMGRRQKTRPSAELDGEPVDMEKNKLIKLNRQDIPLVSHAFLLALKYSKKNR
jgi:hypothetical protein